MNTTHQHMSIDSETLGFADKSIVLSVAITPFYLTESDITFDELVDRTFNVKFKVQPQLDKGRTSDKDTIRWWKKQCKEAKKYATKKTDADIDVYEGLKQINLFIDKSEYTHKRSYFFERGMGFDTNKLQSLYSDFEINSNINYWRGREIRTINDWMADVENGKWELPEGRPSNFIEHYAVHDAALDALRLVKLHEPYLKYVDTFGNEEKYKNFIKAIQYFSANQSKFMAVDGDFNRHLEMLKAFIS